VDSLGGAGAEAAVAAADSVVGDAAAGAGAWAEDRTGAVGSENEGHHVPSFATVAGEMP
jgi:hypothetical protein